MPFPRTPSLLVMEEVHSYFEVILEILLPIRQIPVVLQLPYYLQGIGTNLWVSTSFILVLWEKVLIKIVVPLANLVASVLLQFLFFFLFLVELTDFQYRYCLSVLILQILVKLNSMSCYQLAYHQSAQHTRQLLLSVGKVLLGSRHLEKQFVGILMAKLF